MIYYSYKEHRYKVEKGMDDMKKYTKFDNSIDVNRAITTIWVKSDSVNELKNNLCNVFKVQQFYNWEEFKVLVKDLIGYEF